MRIGIVHRRAEVRRRLSRMISRIPGHDVAWSAGEGEEAVRLAVADPPDLLLMEVGLDGVAPACRPLLERVEAPVLAVTPSVPGPALLDALRSGVRNLLPEPRSGAGGPHPLEVERLARAFRLATEPSEEAPPGPPLVAIGASTGGPPAVARVLGALPPGFAPAVVVAQHVDPSFSAGLVSWLDGQTALPVLRARPGDRPAAGTVYIAAADAHLFLTPEGVFSDLPNGLGNACTPSVDLLFWSLAGAPAGVAVLLTGMGRDGAEGLLNLRRSGWHTIAQDEDSSAVYGMPRVARNMGAAAEVLALAGIAPAIVAAAARRIGSA
ncbi:MAG: chemotaxis protein CheB [Desulfococcaceae bacterium]